MVEVLPPISAEAMPVPFAAAKRWLEGRPETDAFDVEGATAVESDDREPPPVSAPRPVVIWQGEESRVGWPADIRPGQTIVVPASYGAIGHGNWNPESKEPVHDVAELAAFQQGRRPTLRLHPDVVSGLFGAAVTAPVPAPSDTEDLDDRQAVIDWLALHAEQPDDGLRSLVAALRGERRSLRVERLQAQTSGGVNEYFVAIARNAAPAGRRPEAEPLAAEASESSFTEVEVRLSSHLENVGRMAANFAERLGAPADLKADVELTGRWHDAGKADPRFQRWLHGGSEYKALVHPEPLAKSAVRLHTRTARRRARARAGYPEGTRHELMSLALMDAASGSLAPRAGDWPLVQHLVASHHGHCRPFAPWTPDPNPTEVSFAVDGISVSAHSAHDLARLDSGVAERFWLLTRRYGWWGLAWLEAIIRLADHRQSEREQATGGTRNA
jgi:CRISPR-associated endonuclease/helicase Cas3